MVALPSSSASVSSISMPAPAIAGHSCSVEWKNPKALSRNVRHQQFLKLNGQTGKLATNSHDLVFYDPDDRRVVALPFGDIKEMRETKSLFRRRPTIEFTTYDGQHCKLKNFVSREAHQAVITAMRESYHLQRVRASHMRESLQRLSCRMSTAHLEPSPVASAALAFQQRTQTISSPSSKNMSPIVENGAQRGSAASQMFEMEVDAELVSLPETLPAGAVEVLPNVEKYLKAPDESGITFRPHHPETLAREPATEFTLEGITVEQFWKLFWQDNAVGTHQRESVEIASITKWTDARAGGLRRRRISGITAIEKDDISIGVPDFSQFTTEQWLVQYPHPENGCTLRIDAASQAPDCPFGDHFEVITSWHAVPIPEENAIRVLADVGAHFTHRFSIIKAFRGQIVKGGVKSAVAFARHAKAFVAAYLDNPLLYETTETEAGDETEDPADTDGASTISVEGSSGSFRSEDVEVMFRELSSMRSEVSEGDASEPAGSQRFTVEESRPLVTAENMRCLALVAHNNMKPALQEFCRQHKDILRHFRITGTSTTIKVLTDIFKESEGGAEDIIFGPVCESGPLGGDAQIASMLVMEDLGGAIFLQDPLNCHPHDADCAALIRLFLVHNVLFAQNLTSAHSLMLTLGMAVAQQNPELIPSFFRNMESPVVEDYRQQQASLARRFQTQRSTITDKQLHKFWSSEQIGTALATEPASRTWVQRLRGCIRSKRRSRATATGPVESPQSAARDPSGCTQNDDGVMSLSSYDALSPMRSRVLNFEGIVHDE